MSDRLINTADLGRIESNLSAITYALHAIDNRVTNVEGAVAATHQQLQALMDELQTFIAVDTKVKNVQLAETRLVKVRQEIETRFAHHGEVRRLTTGILQAIDVGLVQQETIRSVSEEQMLLAPRYWLAPAVVAMAAWINDNHSLADRALTEALKRNTLKTCLFLALITRRGGRFQSARNWLERYFSLIDPTNVNRELIVLIDAYAGGTFGPDAESAITKRIQNWIDELSQRVGFVEEQQRRWVTALESKAQPLPDKAYPYLRQYSPTWSLLATVLEGANLHEICRNHFEGVFEAPSSTPQNLATAVDDLLDRLVAGFDDEELPLRREELGLSLIIQADGDKAKADSLMAAEQSALDRQVDLTQRLTDWAMHPETSSATRTSQRYAISLARDWIVSAHGDITSKNRASVPLDIDLQIDNWRGSTRDGSNEEELLSSVDLHIDSLKTYALAQVKLAWYHWAAVALGLLAVVSAPGLVTLAAMGGIALWIFLTWNGLSRQKADIERHFESMRESYRQHIRVLCAEVVDWRREYTEADLKAEGLREFLSQINPQQCIATGKELGHSAGMNRAVEQGIASQLPEWELQPVIQIVRRRGAAG